jgi:Holliday junction DNA helicase RuvA
MIAHLRGRLFDKQPNRLIVDVAGVGYDVAVPVSTFYAAGDPGTEVALRIHTHVREDQIALYGFSTAFELSVFERLIDVSGIGPRLALAVLSGMEPRDLVAAIQRSDLARLTRIPGVGRKTAERLVVELRDRLPQAVPGDTASEGAAGPAGDRRRDDLASALANLGYDRRAIDTALDAVLKESAETEPTFEQHLRAALRTLSRA